jgi:hypothetical protein
MTTRLHGLRFTSPSYGEYGGIFQLFTAGASTFNYGDVVYFSAASTVLKSATVANYVDFAGVVVGGDLTQDQQLLTEPSTGTALVQIYGIAPVILSGSLTLGRVMADSGTAGRVANGTTAGQILGTLLVTGTVGNLGRMLINHR